VFIVTSTGPDAPGARVQGEAGILAVVQPQEANAEMTVISWDEMLVAQNTHSAFDSLALTLDNLSSPPAKQRIPAGKGPGAATFAGPTGADAGGKAGSEPCRNDEKATRQKPAEKGKPAILIDVKFCSAGEYDTGLARQHRTSGPADTPASATRSWPITPY